MKTRTSRRMRRKQFESVGSVRPQVVACWFLSVAVAVVVLFALNPANTWAQRLQVGDDNSVPIAGSGQDYIHLLNETVNPANGTLNLRFPLPVPKGRGITLPAALTYNSNVIFMDPHIAYTSWWSSGRGISYSQISNGNWSFDVPFATYVSGGQTI